MRVVVWSAAMQTDSLVEIGAGSRAREDWTAGKLGSWEAKN